MTQLNRRHIDRQVLDESWEELYENGPCAFLSMLPDGTIVRTNQTFLNLTNYSGEAVEGQSLQKFLTVPGKIFYDTHYAPLLRMQGAVKELAFDLQCADGRRVPILLNSKLKTDEDGEPMLIIAAIFDASDRRRYEQELLRARRDAEKALRIKADLLAMMSHDIRTPASSIVMAVDLLQRLEILPQQARAFNILRSSSATLIKLLNEVLDYSRLESGTIRLDEDRIELRSWLEDVVLAYEQAGEQKGLSIELELGPAVPSHVIGDEVKIAQVLGNLIGNAVKFTERGKVRLGVESIRRDTASVVLRFSVSDTGIGIPEKRLPYIFDEFTQASAETSRRYGGSGLGLAICQRILALYNSKLDVESVEGAGSTFAFELSLRTSDGNAEGA